MQFCEECMVQASTLPFMTSSCDSFKKITFARNIVQLGGENKIGICFVKLVYCNFATMSFDW
jgi:hypothetical protein